MLILSRQFILYLGTSCADALLEMISCDSGVRPISHWHISPTWLTSQWDIRRLSHRRSFWLLHHSWPSYTIADTRNQHKQLLFYVFVFFFSFSHLLVSFHSYKYLLHLFLLLSSFRIFHQSFSSCSSLSLFLPVTPKQL